MADRINRVPEDQIFNPAVSVRAHYQQIRLYFASISNNFPAGVGTVPDRSLHIDLALAQRLDQTVQIVPPRLDFRSGSFLSVNLTRDAFFHVQQVDSRMIPAGQAGRVA